MSEPFADLIRKRLSDVFAVVGAPDMTPREDILCNALISSAAQIDWLINRLEAVESHPALSIPPLSEVPFQ